MTKLERLNALLEDKTLDIPSIHRRVDKCGSNIKWLKKNLSKRNSEHASYVELTFLLNKPIGFLVAQPHIDFAYETSVCE